MRRRSSIRTRPRPVLELNAQLVKADAVPQGKVERPRGGRERLLAPERKFTPCLGDHSRHLLPYGLGRGRQLLLERISLSS